MRKLLLLFALICISSASMLADDVKYTFEEGALSDQGWTELHNGLTAKWSLQSYASNTQFTGKYISTPESGGAVCAMSLTGGSSAAGTQDVDNWLISPATLIPEGGILSFLLSYNAQYNNNSSLDDAERYSFDVLVADADQMTDINKDGFTLLTSKMLANRCDWGMQAIDLSAYQGKRLYIAFRQHGAPNTVHTTTSKVVSDYTFIDNVTISTKKVYDIALTTAPTFQNGAFVEQPVTVGVTNYGLGLSGATFVYQLGAQDAVRETLNREILAGETFNYTFTTPVHFLETTGQQQVNVWVEADGDAINSNDSVTGKATIYPLSTLPYKYSTETAKTDFYSPSTSYKKGWFWMDNYSAWIYTQYNTSKSYYLYTTHRYALKADSLNVTFSGSSTTDGASLQVFLTQDMKTFTQIGTVDLTASKGVVETYGIKCQVPTEGEYIICLQPTTTANAQVAMADITIGGDAYVDPSGGDEPLPDGALSYNFPYSTSFEAAQDTLDWVSLNPDKDADYWGIENTSPYVLDGEKTMFINRSGYVHNDYAVSPVIKVTESGKARLSFYYGSRTNYGGAKVKALLVPAAPFNAARNNAARVDSIVATATEVGSWDVSTGFLYANTIFEVPAGEYRIALYNTGGYDEVFVDDFRFDREQNEASISAASLSVSGLTYGADSVVVKATVQNDGLAALSDYSLRYKLTYIDASDNKQTKEVTEIPGTEIASGESLEYTFKETFNANLEGSYGVVVELVANDADQKNNQFTANGITVTATLKAPLLIDFETNKATMTLDNSDTWAIGNFLPYDGKNALHHQGAAKADGDWAFLTRMQLTAGTYDFSYFWKTMTNGTLDTQRQSFAIYLGTEQNAEAMTTLLSEKSDVACPGLKHEKELSQFTIPEDGVYYLGVKVTTQNTSGSLSIDNIAITVPTHGQDVTVAGYKADFANNESEWYHYNPNNYSTQWTLADDGTSMKTTVTVAETGNKYTPGLYRSPALYLEKGESYYVDYASTVAAPDSTAKTIFKLLVADKDYTAAYQVLNNDGAGEKQLVYAPEASGNYYFAFQADADKSAEFLLNSFSVKKVPTGIAIDEENFPDERFRTLISATFDKDKDGYLNDAEIATATSLNMNSQGVTNCKGIEYLTELTELLAHYNSITQLDLSNNKKLERFGLFMGALTSLDLSNNPEITEVNVSFNNITELNLTGCTKIKNLQLVCNQIKNLDVTKMPELTTLTVAGNPLLTLDLSKNPNLATFTQKFSGTNSAGQTVTYAIERTVASANRKVDLALLTDDKVDSDHLTSLSGATLDGSVLTFDQRTATYKYATGNSKIPTMDVILHEIFVGDVNSDGVVNTSDVTALINKILGTAIWNDTACDVNGDGEINTSDVTALINIILQ